MGRECCHGSSAEELGMKLGNWVWWNRESTDLQADYLAFPGMSGLWVNRGACCNWGLGESTRMGG